MLFVVKITLRNRSRGAVDDGSVRTSSTCVRSDKPS